MRLLLDTQIFLWCLDQTARIPPLAREAIDAAGNAAHCSGGAADVVLRLLDLDDAIAGRGHLAQLGVVT